MKHSVPPVLMVAALACPALLALEQPTSIPGSWEWTPQPLPPAAEIASRPVPDRPVYGLYVWAEEHLKFRDEIRDMGWKNFRLSGPINDDIMRLYAEEGAEVMFTAPARKPFATPEAPNGPWRNRANFDSDEAFIADYLSDLDQVLHRYGPEGSFWKENPRLPFAPLRLVEIYNEPNFWYLDTAREDKKNHFPPNDPVARDAQNASRQALYAKLLEASGRHIKERHPGVSVVAFGAGGVNGADVPFIRAVHQASPGLASSYDILSTHPYVRPAPPEASNVRPFGKFSICTATEQIRDIQREFNASSKPLWWTELNWTIFPQDGGRFNESAERGRKVDRDITPELQAAYAVRAFALALRLGVERLHLMSFTDTDGVNSGMFEADGKTPRPIATALRTMMSLLPFPAFRRAIVENEDGVTIQEFAADVRQADSPRVIIASRVQGPQSISIPWTHPSATITAIDGSTSSASPVDGQLALEIGPLPVFVTP